MVDLVEQHAIRRGAKRLGLAVVAALGLVSAPAQARPTLDGARMSQLNKYEVLTFSDPFGGGIERGKAIGVFDATPEEVFRVATDFTRYAEFIPRVSGIEQVARNRDGAQVKISVELPWPAGQQWIEASYKFERGSGEVYRVRFDMQRGSMKQYLGSLYIEPWSKNQAALTYELVAEPSIAAPKSFINKGVRRSVFSYVHALRQRVNEMHRLGLLHPVLPPINTQASTIVSPNVSTLKARR